MLTYGGHVLDPSCHQRGDEPNDGVVPRMSRIFHETSTKAIDRSKISKIDPSVERELRNTYPLACLYGSVSSQTLYRFALVYIIKFYCSNNRADQLKA